MHYRAAMDRWLDIPEDRPANRSGRLCVLIAVTALLVLGTPGVWAAVEGQGASHNLGVKTGGAKAPMPR